MSSARPDREGLPVDARLAAPESRCEIDEGRMVFVPPAHEPHASRHSKLSALLEAHVAADYDVAVDMLTRTSPLSDVAPDVSVFPLARSPVTGGRQLEELAFEVVSTQTLAESAAKAKMLADRGVRRVFAIDVSRKRAFEWSAALGTWTLCATTGAIEDRVLAVALPIDALVNATKADDAIVRALAGKGNPVLAELVATRAAERYAVGRARGLAEGLVGVLDARGIALSEAQRACLLATSDPQVLEAWIRVAATCRDAAELFASDRER